MDYGLTAKYYSSLSSLLFGDAILKAHVLAIQHFSPGSSLLILGGGTGTFLPYVQNYKLHFVDISDEMLNLAKRQDTGPVQFEKADARTMPLVHHYDGIIFPFLLDSWTAKEVQDRMAHLPASCPVVIADFCEKPLGIQKLLLHAMYLFFSLFAGLRVNTLPPIEKIMRETSRHKVTETSLFHAFIEIKVYS
jgi:SAM-dependent methyltransferase